MDQNENESYPTDINSGISGTVPLLDEEESCDQVSQV